MSFSHLATVGTLSYNGHTFDGASAVTVNVEFVKDDAERTVIYSRHTIEVHAFISDGSSTDSQLETIRALLSHQGQSLTFINKGFGDNLIVNAAGGGGLRDVKWGPTPEVLSWEPVGASGACEIVWKVTTCVPVCGNGLSDRCTGIMAFNYGVDVTIDERGLSTRTCSGYIEIAQTRFPGKLVPDSADNYRFFIQPSLPDGFQRSQTWTITPDKSRVEFTITDRQLPTKNPYPMLVTNIRGNHRVALRRGRKTSALQLNTISLDVELVMGAPQALAWQIFGGLIKARIDWAARNGKVAFLDEVVADEEIFGLSYSFACSYRLLSNLGQILGQSPGDTANTNPTIPPGIFDLASTGMWQPVGDSGSWNRWKASLKNAFGNRGIAGLTVPANNDVIVDLCGAGYTLGTVGQEPPPVTPVRLIAGVLKNQKPPQERSYLTYKQRVVIRHQKYVARQKALQQSRKPAANGQMFSTDRANFSEAQGQSASSTPTPDVLQESGTGSYVAMYMGSAERAGYEIPRPAMQSIGGQIPVETESTFIMEQLGTSFGCPVFRADWCIVYDLPSAPGGVSGPPKLEA